MRTPAAPSTASEERTAFGWVDAVVLLAIFGLLWSVLHFGRGMLVHFDECHVPPLSTSLNDIPYYAGRTVLRMWTAFACSLLFMDWGSILLIAMGTQWYILFNVIAGMAIPTDLKEAART